MCGKYVTLDLNNPQVRLGTTAPNLDDVLPYNYAWNTTMGTPLYKSVPSREDMLTYEPYLKAEAQKAEAKRRAKEDDTPAPMLATIRMAQCRVMADVANASETKKPWWQNDFDGGKPDIKLSDLDRRRRRDGRQAHGEGLLRRRRQPVRLE